VHLVGYSEQGTRETWKLLVLLLLTTTSKQAEDKTPPRRAAPRRNRGNERRRRAGAEEGRTQSAWPPKIKDEYKGACSAPAPLVLAEERFATAGGGVARAGGGGGGMRNRPAAREAAVTYLEHAGGREVDVDGEDAHALGLRRHLSLSLSPAAAARRRNPRN
jgi:hypothetical protein